MSQEAIKSQDQYTFDSPEFLEYVKSQHEGGKTVSVTVNSNKNSKIYELASQGIVKLLYCPEQFSPHLDFSNKKSEHNRMTFYKNSAMFISDFAMSRLKQSSLFGRFFSEPEAYEVQGDKCLDLGELVKKEASPKEILEFLGAAR